MRDALDGMRRTNKYTLFRREWSHFLLAAKGVDSVLFEGAKGCGPSQTWLNLKRKLRKDDELLSYIHHARDSADHGLGSLTPQSYQIEPPPTGALRVFMERDELGNAIFRNEDPPYNFIEFPLTGLLSPVVDSRYGTVFPVPTTHLGLPIADATVFGVGALVLAYLENMVAEAVRLPRQS